MEQRDALRERVLRLGVRDDRVVAGAIVGSLAVVALLESTRFVAAVIPGLTAVQVASLREFVIAISLIAIMQLKPEGVFQSVNQKARADAAPRGAKASASAESEPSSNVLASRA